MPYSDLTTPSVLIVDDDPATLRLLQKIVSSAGYQVFQARDGSEAFALVQRECPDLVISDWEMEGMNGPALCEAIRREPLPKYVYLMLLTARATDAEMVQGLEAGADDFISKPVKAPVLLARLRAGTRVLATERRLLDFSQRDSLTGVLNRRAFHEQIVQEWERNIRYGRPLSCVMADLDFFKRINDTYGHKTGDTVLKATANVLQAHCRSVDVICRYGGEEFCILLPETDEAGAAIWAERARAALRELSIPVEGRTVRISSSLGVAQRLVDTTNPEMLIDLADQALAVAKQTGRNRVIRRSSFDDSTGESCDSVALRRPLQGVLARDVMIPAVLCPAVDDTVAQVTDLLLELRLNSVPVVRQDGQLAGIISEIDLAQALAGSAEWDRPICDLLKTDVVTFAVDTPAQQVLDFLGRAALGRVVVVEEGRPTGVISRGCFLRWMRNHWANRAALAIPPSVSSTALSQSNPHTKAMRLVEVAEQQLANLRAQLGTEGTDVVPCIIGEASKLQEVVNDLLAQSGAGRGIS